MTSRFCFGIIAKHSARRNLQIIVGVYDIEGPPVPIPNTVVKLNRAENTWWVTAREDRSTPTPIVGNYDIEGPPVPIPNTVVKLNRAENTWWVTAREDRSLPTLTKSSHPIGWLFFCCENFVAKNQGICALFCPLEVP